VPSRPLPMSATDSFDLGPRFRFDAPVMLVDMVMIDGLGL
jgi:hypothetical protein